MTYGYATAAMTLSSIAISVGNARADPGEEKQLPTRFACENAPTGSGARELSKDLLIYR